MKFLKYTEELHIEGLKLLLSKRSSCTYCPMNLIREKLSIAETIELKIDSSGELITSPLCNICRNFIGIDNDSYSGCPCLVLKKEEAIKRTWIRLEEVLDKNDPFFNNEEVNYGIYNDTF